MFGKVTRGWGIRHKVPGLSCCHNIIWPTLTLFCAPLSTELNFCFQLWLLWWLAVYAGSECWSRQSSTLHPFPFGSSMHTLPGSLCITGFHPWAAYPSSTGSWLWWVHGRRQEGGKRTAGMSPASAVSVSPQQMSLDASQHLTLPPL